jgi:hypothetical protein
MACGALRTPPINTDDGRRVILIVTPDNCVRVQNP